MTDLMYTPLENVFAATMEREGKTVTAVSSGKEFTAFFRRCDDGQSTEDRITVYYDVSAPVEQGSLIQYGRKTYILINKETEENTCYYKSYGIAINGLLTTNDGIIRNVPIYGYDMKDGLAYANNVFSMISGNVEFITEITDTIKALDINDTFNVYGRTFEVDNIYMKDGLFHIITQVTTNHPDPSPEPTPEPEPEVYKAVIETSTNTIKVGGSYKSLTAKVVDASGNDVTEDWMDARYTWTCSVDGVDYTDNCTWRDGTEENQKKLKFSTDNSYIGKTLLVTVNIRDVMSTDVSGKVTGSIELEITD